MSLRGVLCGWALVAFASGTFAQQGVRIQSAPQMASQRVLGTVTGHVTCSDTQQPARFAEVTLMNAEEVSGSSGNSGRFGFGRRVSGRTDLNGNFTVEAEPGDYYVTASATGYVSPVAAAAARLGSSATAADLLSGLPEVHVTEDGGGPVNLTIDRGGVISGKLQWEDGSPAAGISVGAMSPTSSGISTYGAFGAGRSTDLTRLVMEMGGGLGRGGYAMSDDRGVFRLTGLAPGSYVVRAMVMTPSAAPGGGGYMQRLSSLTLYAPGKMRRSDAQTIVLKAGEERDDVAFTINLSALHTVSGHVGAADGSTVASGRVRLTDSQDSTLSRDGSIQADGSFVVQWVPAGTYTLAVSGASSSASTGFFGGRGQPSGGTSGNTSFKSFQESFTVSDSDVSGVSISLMPTTVTAQ